MIHTSASGPSPAAIQRGAQGAASRGSLLHALETSLSPLVGVACLWALAMGMDGGTMGADHPIAWCHAFDGGRSWYSGLGHDAAVYADRHFIAQLRGGLRYVAGRSDDC